MLTGAYALALILIIVSSAIPIPMVYAQQYTLPTVNMKPSMEILVYPDGSIRVIYELNAVIENIRNNVTGNIMLGYHEESTENGMYVEFGGGGEVKPITPSKKTASSEFSIQSLLNILGSSKEYLINGSVRIKAISTKGLEKNYTIINITKSAITMKNQEIKLVFDVYIEGNITISEECIGENITSLLQLLKNITWIKLENLSITKENKAYHINGVLVILIDEIIKQGLEFNIITEADAEEISKCINEY